MYNPKQQLICLRLAVTVPEPNASTKENSRQTLAIISNCSLLLFFLLLLFFFFDILSLEGSERVQTRKRYSLTLNRWGMDLPSSLCCAVSSRKLKLCDFYCILIGFHFEYKPVSSDINCGHTNPLAEECLVSNWLKSVNNCKFLLKSFSNFNLSFLFVISISKLPPILNFK